MRALSATNATQTRPGTAAVIRWGHVVRAVRAASAVPVPGNDSGFLHLRCVVPGTPETSAASRRRCWDWTAVPKRVWSRTIGSTAKGKKPSIRDGFAPATRLFVMGNFG